MFHLKNLHLIQKKISKNLFLLAFQNFSRFNNRYSNHFHLSALCEYNKPNSMLTILSNSVRFKLRSKIKTNTVIK